MDQDTKEKDMDDDTLMNALILMPEELAEKIPELYEQDGKGADTIIYAKIFNPVGQATWYIAEYDGEDLAFCYAVVLGPQEAEWGYQSMKELQEYKMSTTLPGLTLERDIWWEPKRFGDINLETAS